MSGWDVVSRGDAFTTYDELCGRAGAGCILESVDSIIN